MAGIENLRKRILNDDEEKAREIISEAETKAQEMLKMSKEKAKAVLEESKVKAEKDAKDRKERIIARAQLDARNNMLSTKQEMIDKVLRLSEEKVLKMNNKEYSEFIQELLLSSVETGDEEVIFPERDKTRIDPGLVARVNEMLISKGKKGSLRIGPAADGIKSGFILKHGGIEINCSVDSQIRVLRDNLEGEIVKILFENS